MAEAVESVEQQGCDVVVAEVDARSLGLICDVDVAGDIVVAQIEHVDIVEVLEVVFGQLVVAQVKIADRTTREDVEACEKIVGGIDGVEDVFLIVSVDAAEVDVGELVAFEAERLEAPVVSKVDASERAASEREFAQFGGAGKVDGPERHSVNGEGGHHFSFGDIDVYDAVGSGNGFIEIGGS